MIGEARGANELAEDWDVAIIGAGPAGALAACLLAKNHRTLLIDKETFPRSKVCGGCLNAKALRVLQDSGLSELSDISPSDRIDQLVLRSAGKSASIELPPGKSVARIEFDAAIVERAIRAGAQFADGIQARVLSARASDSRRSVEIQSESGRRQVINAKVVIAADGLGHPSLSTLKDFSVHVARNSYIGLGCSVRAQICCDPNTILMALGRDGYVGCVLGGGDLRHIAAAVDAMALKNHGPHVTIARILNDAGLDSGWVSDCHWSGTRPLTCYSEHVAGHRLFLLGDAAGYVEPFTGEGMAWALASAQDVIPFVEQACGRWEAQLSNAWSSRVRRTNKNQRICRSVSCLLRRRQISHSAVCMLGRYPRLASFIVRSINHSST